MFDKEEYTVGVHFLSPIFNGDYTGLEDQEESQLDQWLREFPLDQGHFSCDYQERFLAHCAVTGLLSDCINICYHRRQY